MAFVCLVLALVVCNAERNRRNVEAADLASELYRRHLLRELEKPNGGGPYPQAWTAVVRGQGDVVDLATASGRVDLMSRINEYETAFRVRCADGHVMEYSELFTEPYIIASWTNDDPRAMFSSNTPFEVNVNNTPLHRRTGRSQSAMEATIPGLGNP